MWLSANQVFVYPRCITNLSFTSLKGIPLPLPVCEAGSLHAGLRHREALRMLMIDGVSSRGVRVVPSRERVVPGNPVS
jgi:hypothetical protein